MKLRDFVSPGDLVVDVAAAAVKKIRNRPKAVKRRAAKQQAARLHPADEIDEPFFNDDPTEGFMSEAQQSFLRGILKFVAGALAAKGLIDVGEAAALQIALEALAAGIIGVVGFVLSHRKHA